ncbi:MAG: magnesium transporter [Propionibacterium sp.]|nr:magnesium transporter [Propionibacterium sp.]
MPVVDTAGDRVGTLRDVVIQVRAAGRAPRAKGLVVELFARHRIFVPMARVYSVTAMQVVISGVVNTRRFERRDAENLVIGDLFDAKVNRVGHQGNAFVFDVAMRQVRSHDWEVSEVALRDTSRSRFGRRGHDVVVDWSEVSALSMGSGRSTSELLAQMEDMKPADIARELHDLSPQRRAEVVAALDDETLADAVEELPEDEQIQLISALGTERAADVLGEMDPDDAADLVAELSPDVAETLLREMEPDDADDVRRLLLYEEFTAGGLMTPEPVVVSPDDTIATALAKVRNPDVTPALASQVYVARAPLETPTGRFLGAVHIQRLLREPPSMMVSAMIDGELQPLHPHMSLAQVSRYFATYNLVCAPVVDDDRLLGAVTVDDVIDHMLPDDWRGDQMDGMEPEETDDGR